MDELQIFKNEEFGEIRWIKFNEKDYAVAIDIAKSLGYKNPNDAISRHCKGYVKHAVPTKSGVQQMNIIPEGDIYRLTAKSELPGAEKFESWIFDDILPSIRKHGMYATDELLDNPDLLIAAATKLKEERAARIEAEKQRNKLIHQTKLYTTSEIAKESGLRSATQLNNLLAEKKVQYKQNKTWLLYSKYAECGYVSIKQDVLDNGHIIYDRKWTGSGRDFILNLLS
ncbi:phage antirepressor [Clostridium cagae]|uniref:phage antirepressor n=1 Tax=Clostridium cagae TaxID=2080751 RepID=UPI003F76E13B